MPPIVCLLYIYIALDDIPLETSGYLMDTFWIFKKAAYPRVSRAIDETEIDPPDQMDTRAPPGGW